MYKFILTGNITSLEGRDISKKISQDYNNKVTVSFKSLYPTPVTAGYIQVAFTIAGAIAAIISAYYIILDSSKKKVWDKKRIKGIIDQEMLRYDIVDYNWRIYRGENLLKNSSSKPCLITVTEKQTKNKYQIYIYKDGKAYTVKVKNN